MAARYGILGQLSPPAATLAELYRVPVGKHATVRMIAVNRHGSGTQFWIALSPAGAAIQDAHYVSYSEAIGGTEVRPSTTVMLNEGDVVRVRATNGTMSFTLTGIEDDN